MRRRLAMTMLLMLPTLLVALSSGAPAQAPSGPVEATVSDEKGKPIEDAVVSLIPLGSAPAAPSPASAIMDQHDKEFVPYVLPIFVGTRVTFPNRDNIRHHVYSFSSAKKFELPLYIGTPAAPVAFDKPGVVALGCNIHDWMLAYIYVLTTPYFAKTGADGKARVEGLDPGAYEARVWHAPPRRHRENRKAPVAGRGRTGAGRLRRLAQVGMADTAPAGRSVQGPDAVTFWVIFPEKVDQTGNFA
jgi:plastocyanin